MDEIHFLHEVSVKIALYSYDRTKVLIMVYPSSNGMYGLPGGHVEERETPDQALLRELDEELGITLANFEKKSFFLRGGTEGSIILAYTASAPNDLVMTPPDPDKEFGAWMTVDELDGLEKISPEYKKLVIENWPHK
ncbi:NUDIX hydrolase [Candidatus Saccharibacteria bacterium]|nr:NUDIX hydrolase [Candidatus Saccharibacteria bacterium]